MFILRSLLRTAGRMDSIYTHISISLFWGRFLRSQSDQVRAADKSFTIRALASRPHERRETADKVH